MRHILDFIKNYWLAFLTGALVGTSYIPFPPWALGFCLVPLLVFALKNSQNLKRIFYAGWISQFTFTLIGFHWIAVVSKEYGHLPTPVAILITLLFASFMHLHIPVSLLLSAWLKNKLNLHNWAFLVSFAAIFSLLENHWPMIFPWNLGYPLLWANSGWAQWADILGFAGLSFLVYLCSALFTWVGTRKWDNRSLACMLSLVVIFIAGEWTGRQRVHFWQETDVQKQILVVQANIGNLDKIYAEKGIGFQQDITDAYFRLTRQGLAQHPDTDLVIWPESAFPDYLNTYNHHRRYSKQLVEFVKEINKPLLTGGYSQDPAGTEKKKDYNGLFLMQPNGVETQPYHKTYLLIFGEYIPYGDKFEWLAKINPGGAGFGRGSGPTVMNWDGQNIGLQICYESLYPEFSAALAKKDAHFLVNVTNDSWFSSSNPQSIFHTSFEAYQHMIMTLARAIEVRRPLIRSTNTGITTAVLASGQILEKSPTQTEWFHPYQIKYKSQAPLTLHSQFGSWLPFVVLLIITATLVAGRRREGSKTS